MRLGGFRCVFCVSALLAVAGGAGFIWSKVASSHALVAVAGDVGRPGTNAVHVVTDPSADSTYRVAVAIPDDCHAGFDCDVTMTILPAGEWHTNLEYPTKFNGKGDRQLAIRPSRVDKHDGTATVHVMIRPRTAGVHQLDGVLKLSVCTGEWCRVAHHAVTVTLPAS